MEEVKNTSKGQEGEKELEAGIAYKEKLATKLVEYAQDELTINLPYFNRAIIKMPIRFYQPKFIEEDLIKGAATNTKELIFDANFVINTFKESSAKLTRIVLHEVLHCLYKHPFRYKMLNRDYWDLACDVAIEREIIDLKISSLSLESDFDKINYSEVIRKQSKKLTAEAIYTAMIENKSNALDWLRYADLFKMDTHAVWGSNKDLEFNEGLFLFDCDEAEIDQAGAEWSEVKNNVHKDKDLLEQGFGLSPSEVEDYVGAVRGDNKDYSDFLREFAGIKEEVKVNPDEFDYIYYTYGLELYEDMPLIEPLEYKDTMQIYDFAIVIDTSGSCRGSVVKNFLKRTYSVLKESELFGVKMNVHIIFCDNQVQEDHWIISEEAFDRFISNVTVKGAGGTDFRPAFEYVERLKASGQYTNLQGMLYLSDAMGLFPEEEPSFKTALIVMPQEEYDIPWTPDWARVRYVDRSDLEER